MFAGDNNERHVWLPPVVQPVTQWQDICMQIDILHRKLIELLEIDLAVSVSSKFLRFLAIF